MFANNDKKVIPGEYEYKWVKLERIGKVLKITFDRTKQLNALSDELESEIHLALDEGDADDGVNCMVITGNGHFGVGYDMANEPGEKNVLDPGRFDTVGDFIAFWQEADDAIVRRQLHFFNLKKPVIAAVEGYCLGGSMWLAMASDMAYCSETAVFGQPEIRHCSNSTFLIPALCGRQHASRWLYTGDHFDGKEAERIGLVNECVPPEKLMDTVMYVAERVAKVPHLSVRYMKSLIMQGTLAAGLASAMEYTAPISTLGHTAHSKEREEFMKLAEEKGIKAFLEKRDGPFLPEPMGPKSKVK
ncbi:hypothetical protein DCC39_10710 [Pueribacillus theae]|uniref:Enoyl-CoA hydratase n=1 Tax=Pueribacillus theae TaxID=2171751 RepID=A0A2U1JZS6_9BACI|nr:enoyl-CoA hydratase/isomerase family protein [Pueribacillus theae]PWA10750.1 hypothetical protein DCC39_10710 [Pueribacillus theae]